MTASIRDDYAGLQKNCQTARHKLTYVSPIASQRIVQRVPRLGTLFERMQ